MKDDGSKGTSKIKKSADNPGFFAQGGKGHMFGKQRASQQGPGITSHDPQGSDQKFASGGKGKMFGKQSASPAKPNQIGKNG